MPSFETLVRPVRRIVILTSGDHNKANPTGVLEKFLQGVPFAKLQTTVARRLAEGIMQRRQTRFKVGSGNACSLCCSAC